MLLTFACPLERTAAEDPDSYGVQQWNYRWSAGYGSPEFRVSQPQAEGRAISLTVRSATLQPDQRTVFLAIPELQPVMQIAIRFALEARGGTAPRVDRQRHDPAAPGPRPAEIRSNPLVRGRAN